MGIYPNHGVEYWIEVDKNFDNNVLKRYIENLKNDMNFNMYATPSNNICVLSTSRTDNRLVESNYYKERKTDWFNHRTFCEHWREFIDDQTLLDIKMTEIEINVINKIKEQLNEHITGEGWFDVNTIGYSY